MRSDLQELEITKGELRHLSGIDPDEIFRPSLLQNSRRRLTFFINELLIALALTPIIVGAVYIFLISPIRGASTKIALLLLILVPIVIIAGRWFWLKNTIPKLLVNLLDDVDRYHSVLKAIDINDQLETAGTPGSTFADRTQVMAALKLTREDLIRAFMSERILRENKSTIAANPEIFSNNLAALKAMQVNVQAGEYGRLLNEALQIGLNVQAEMRKLQNPN